MSENIFANEWIECLEAHYIHVIRTQDKVTEPSLTIVMHSAGFTDQQLAELRVRATMHVDDVGADFVPDLNVLDGHDHSGVEAVEAAIFNIPINLPIAGGEAVPEVVLEASAALDNEDSFAEIEGETVEPKLETDDEERAAEAEPGDDIEKPDPDAPQQLSLF